MTQLDYTSPLLSLRTIRLVRGFYRAAVFCAITPMITGIVIVIAYWATYARWLPVAGFLLFPIGSGFIVVGVAFLIICSVFFYKSKRRGLEPPVRRRPWFIALLLLLANFPVAFACAFIGAAIMNSQIVDLLNETGAPIDSIVVEARGVHEEIHTLPDLGRVRVYLSIQGDTEVTAVVTQAGSTQKITIEGYVSGDGFHDRVHIKPGLASDVEHLK